MVISDWSIEIMMISEWLFGKKWLKVMIKWKIRDRWMVIGKIVISDWLAEKC